MIIDVKNFREYYMKCDSYLERKDPLVYVFITDPPLGCHKQHLLLELLQNCTAPIVCSC